MLLTICRVLVLLHCLLVGLVEHLGTPGATRLEELPPEVLVRVLLARRPEAVPRLEQLLQCIRIVEYVVPESK